MTADEYQRAALRTELTPGFVNDHNGKPSVMLSRLMHAAMGMETEVGELIDMLKKHYVYGRRLDVVNAMEEASDCLWYIALALDACGYTMEQAMERNIEKLRTRYPERFTSEQALNRDLAAERAALERK